MLVFNFLKVKIEIYHQTIRVIMKNKSKYLVRCTIVWPNKIALKKIVIKDMLIIYANKNI